TFNRTVSANLGMSYSIANVLIEAGISNIARWLPQSMSNNEIHDRLRNKMIRPTSIPQTLEDLHLEHAVCREALRLSLEHHRSLAVGLRGVQRRKGIADIFSQQSSSDNIVDMMGLDLVIGSGGVLSHAPDRKSAALMLLDGFALEGVTQLTVDSIFMLPHLGVFSSVHPQAAEDVLFRDCLVHLGYGIVPIYPAKFSGADLAEVRICGRNVGSIRVGEVAIVETEVGQKEILEVHPCHRSIDVGAGKGVVLEREIITGECGLFLDGRNRPIHFESSVELQAEKQRLILESLEIAH
ncbi:MAG: glutamate mutase L, partial [Bdellovibrionales bacterium]|nr:glutamate mutase L [Bdellovibrionales bacterium]